jgi:hypothetical protein
LRAVSLAPRRATTPLRLRAEWCVVLRVLLRAAATVPRRAVRRRVPRGARCTAATQAARRFYARVPCCACRRSVQLASQSGPCVVACLAGRGALQRLREPAASTHGCLAARVVVQCSCRPSQGRASLRASRGAVHCSDSGSLPLPHTGALLRVSSFSAAAVPVRAVRRCVPGGARCTAATQAASRFHTRVPCCACRRSVQHPSYTFLCVVACLAGCGARLYHPSCSKACATAVPDSAWCVECVAWHGSRRDCLWLNHCMRAITALNARASRGTAWLMALPTAATVARTASAASISARHATTSSAATATASSPVHHT